MVEANLRAWRSVPFGGKATAASSSAAIEKLKWSVIRCVRWRSVSLNSTSMAEKTFSSREMTIPVRFHSRKRRPFFAGVELG